jgi:hypothetical protein
LGSNGLYFFGFQGTAFGPPRMFTAEARLAF